MIYIIAAKFVAQAADEQLDIHERVGLGELEIICVEKINKVYYNWFWLQIKSFYY